jgi:hypothetical protein
VMARLNGSINALGFARSSSIAEVPAANAIVHPYVARCTSRICLI